MTNIICDWIGFHAHIQCLQLNFNKNTETLSEIYIVSSTCTHGLVDVCWLPGFEKSSTDRWCARLSIAFILAQ